MLLQLCMLSCPLHKHGNPYSHSECRVLLSLAILPVQSSSNGRALFAFGQSLLCCLQHYLSIWIFLFIVLFSIERFFLPLCMHLLEKPSKVQCCSKTLIPLVRGWCCCGSVWIKVQHVS